MLCLFPGVRLRTPGLRAERSPILFDGLSIVTDLELPSHLSTAYADIWQKTVNSGREIDQKFAGRGFVSVQAEIDLLNQAFGCESYRIFLESHSNSHAFERHRALEMGMHARLAAAELAGVDELDSFWNEVITHSDLGGLSKQSMLRRYFPERLDALLKPLLPPLLEAQSRERREICRLYSKPKVMLFDKQTSALRKEVCNAVMADAYGKLGFGIFNAKKGVHIYSKKISEEYAIFVEIDVPMLEKNYIEHRASEAVYWPMVPFDRTIYLGSPKTTRKIWITFPPIHNSISATRRERYDSTQSLEILIRADALWYELTISEFEKELK